MEEKQIRDNLVQLGRIFGEIGEVHCSEASLNTKAVQAIQNAKAANPWFTVENIKNAFRAWANSLKEDKLKKWLSAYDLEKNSSHRVGIIMAGNIPMVGLHDLICVLASGNKAICKLSSKDFYLMEFVISLIKGIDKQLGNQIVLAEKLTELDAIIATGSNNSQRYFDFYFGNKPHLFRGNRTSIAVLDGNESEDELKKLADDIFQYFGLGCRNVTKLFLPEDFDLDRIFRAVYHKSDVQQHNKYSNNYDYNKSIYLLNKEAILENGFMLLKEDSGMFTPVSVLFFERYTDVNALKHKIDEQSMQIQCIVSKTDWFEDEVYFGKSQQPEIWDYADRVDTMEFLGKLQ